MEQDKPTVASNMMGDAYNKAKGTDRMSKAREQVKQSQSPEEVLAKIYSNMPPKVEPLSDLDKHLKQIKDGNLPKEMALDVLKGLVQYTEYEDRIKVELFMKDEFKVKDTTYRQWVKNINLKDELDVIPNDVEEYVAAYVARFEIKIDLKNNFTSNHKEYIFGSEYKAHDHVDEKPNNSMPTMKACAEVVNGAKKHDQVALNQMVIFAAKHGLRYTENLQTKAFSIVRDAQQADRMLEIYNTIAYRSMMTTRPNNDKVAVHRGVLELEKLMRAVVDPDQTNVMRAATVMTMFMWQVKNKMRNKTVTDHIMPVLVGEQRSGKSTLIHKLTKTLGDACGHSDFQQITDSKCSEMFATTPVIILDEMGYAKSTDMAILKHNITAPTVQYRPLYTNSKKEVPMKSTFIGASNSDLGSIIYDQSGIRRFYQITTLPQMDFDIINDIDYELIWQGVNENEAGITIDDLALIQADQEEMRQTNIFEDWLIDVISAKSFKYNYDKFYTGKQMFSDFADFADEYSTVGPKIDTRKFSNALAELARKPKYKSVFQRFVTDKRLNAVKYYFIEKGMKEWTSHTSRTNITDDNGNNILNLKDMGK